MKRVVIIILFLFAFLFFGKDTYAQGTYRCAWIPLIGCRAGSENCNTGYHVPDPNFCEGLDNPSCLSAGDRNCVADLGSGCVLTVQNLPAKIGISSNAGISFGQPNTTYTMSMNPSGCSFPLTVHTNGSGVATFSLTCNTRDNYTIQARAGPDICSLAFDVVGENKCVGETTHLPGVCLSIGGAPVLCTPNPPYYFDGKGGCTIFGDGCCVNSGNPPEQTRIRIDTPLGKGSCNDNSLDTAIGCVPIRSTNEFVKFLLAWGAGLAGGIALLLIIYAGFLIITSGGNPQKLQAGKELLTAALMGLILLLFGVFILQLIGVKILNIPGFGQ